MGLLDGKVAIVTDSGHNAAVLRDKTIFSMTRKISILEIADAVNADVFRSRHPGLQIARMQAGTR